MKYFNSQLGNNEETSNIGKLWSVDENNELYKEVENNKNYSQIAAIHKRTEKAIILRVISHIIYPKYKNNEMTLDQLSFEYNIEKDLIEKNIAKYENQPKEPKEPKKPKEQQTNIDKILTDLDNRLLRLEQKIDYIISSFLPEMK
jgi:hypothetical protein